MVIVIILRSQEESKGTPSGRPRHPHGRGAAPFDGRDDVGHRRGAPLLYGNALARFLAGRVQKSGCGVCADGKKSGGVNLFTRI